jgi:uridine phosphorylase
MVQRSNKSELQEGIIRPLKKSSDPTVGPDVLMAIISDDLEYLARLSRARQIPHSGQGLFRLYHTGKGEGEGANLCGPFLGAPVAAMGMEKLIALGAERIWILGCCGSLQPDLRIGDLVIPAGAVSEEGTSQHYPVGTAVPVTDEGLNRIMEKALDMRGEGYRKGKLWTTDAPYRETPAKVRAFQAQGVLAVEMEMSALIAVGLYRGIPVSGILVVSDELFDLKWRPGFSSQRFRKQSHRAAEILLDTITSFKKGDHHEAHEENHGIR